MRPARAPDRRWQHGGWILETTLDRQADLGAQIADILDQVTEDVTAWRQITARFSTRIFCGIFIECENEGFGLDLDVLAHAAVCGLPIDFDLYGPVQDDEGMPAPD